MKSLFDLIGQSFEVVAKDNYLVSGLANFGYVDIVSLKNALLNISSLRACFIIDLYNIKIVQVI